MTMNTPQATPGTPAHRARAHVVYDKATGSILHVHHTVEFEGGTPVAESPAMRALRMAGSRPGAEVIEVEPSEVNHRRPIRVDPGTRTITPS